MLWFDTLYAYVEVRGVNVSIMQKSFTQIAAERKDGKIQNDTCLDKITLETNSEITPPASYIEIEKEGTEVWRSRN